MKNTRTLVFLSLFVAIEVVLTRFISIQTPIVRIGFTFLPIIISAMMFGPVFSGIGAAIADVVGMMLFPSGGYFPGFTFTAFLSGMIYGLILYRKPFHFWRLTLAVVISTVVCSLMLDTLWLYMIMGSAAGGLIPVRLIKAGIMMPIEIATVQIVWRYLAAYRGNHHAKIS